MDEAFLDAAIAEAERGVAAGAGGPFGAVIVRDGRVVARAHNNVLIDNDPTAHAEVSAIRAACRAEGHYALQGAVIYSSCEPCPMCLCAIYWARLDAVYYAATGAQAAAAGFDDARFHEALRRPPEARSFPARHVPHARSEAPFDAWRALETPQRY